MPAWTSVVSRDWSKHDESLKIIRQFYPASYLPWRSIQKGNSRLSRSRPLMRPLFDVYPTARWIRFIPVSFILARFFPRRYFEAVDPPAREGERVHHLTSIQRTFWYECNLVSILTRLASTLPHLHPIAIPQPIRKTHSGKRALERIWST